MSNYRIKLNLAIDNKENPNEDTSCKNGCTNRKRN